MVLVSSGSGCPIRVRMSHQGLDIPPQLGCPITNQPRCHSVTLPCHRGPAVSLGSRCLIGVWMSHWAPDVLLGSKCPTMVQMPHHKPRCHHLALLCHCGPAVSSGSGCPIEVQMSHWGPRVPTGSACPTTIEPCCHHPALLCHHGPAMSLGSRCPVRVQMSLHDPSTSWCAGHAVTIQLWPHEHAGTLPSSCAIMAQRSHHLAVPAQSSCQCDPGTPLQHSCGIRGQLHHCNPAVQWQSRCDVTQLSIHDPTVHPQTSLAVIQLCQWPSCAPIVQLCCNPAVLQSSPTIQFCR